MDEQDQADDHEEFPDDRRDDASDSTSEDERQIQQEILKRRKMLFLEISADELKQVIPIKRKKIKKGPNMNKTRMNSKHLEK